MKRKGEVNPTVIWIVVIFVVIISAMVFFMAKFKDLGSAKQISISQDALLSGVSLSLEKGDVFIIEFGGVNYFYSINEINKERVLIENFKKEIIPLTESSFLSLDLDEDKENDVLINLISLSKKEIELYLETPVI